MSDTLGGSCFSVKCARDSLHYHQTLSDQIAREMHAVSYEAQRLANEAVFAAQEQARAVERERSRLKYQTKVVDLTPLLKKFSK